MADEFKIQYAGSATPIEIQELADGSDTVRAIHSNVDKVIGGSIEKSGGSTAANVAGHLSHLTTTAAVSIEDATIFNDNLGAVVDFLMITITAAGSTGTPDVQIALDGTNYEQTISGIGDFIINRPAGLDSANIKIKSSGATTVAIVDILRGIFS